MNSPRVYLGPLLAVVTLAIGIAFAGAINVIASWFSSGVAIEHPLDTTPSHGSAPRIETLQPPVKTELSCYDPTILTIWHELKKDSGFKDRIGDDAGTLNCSDLLDVGRVDLNQDGFDEYLVRGKHYSLCGGVGNCGFWIFEVHRKARPRLLLSSTDYDGDAWHFGEQVQKTQVRGYANILLKYRFSAAEIGYSTYTWSGSRFEESRCVFEVPKYVRDGEGSVELVSCDEFERRLKDGAANEDAKNLPRD